MQSTSRFARIAPPILLGLGLMGVYLATLAPGLTWANSGADGGDLIAAAATGGVAHPTGYPLYLLLARLFQLLPFGSLAFRTNLLSALTAAGAAVLVYFLTIRALAGEHPERHWLAGLAAGAAFGLAPLPWSQAVITEVYSLHALFVALLLFLVEKPTSERFTSRRKSLLLGLTFGLALGNHITILILLPIVLLAVWVRVDAGPAARGWITRVHVDWVSILLTGLFSLLGALIYLALPLRAGSHPPVNWGNPDTLAGFGWLVTGRLYQDQALITSISTLVDRLRTTAGLFLEQFGVIGLTLSLVGLIVYFRPSRLYFSLLWIAVISTLFSIGYSTNDSYVYLIPAVLCLAVWLGIGVSRLMETLQKPWRTAAAAPVLLGMVVLLMLFVPAGLHWSRVDASKDTRAEEFGRQVLTQAPPNAIVFAEGDQAIFSLWYFHYALRERPDLSVIASDLLGFDWYLQTLRATYPALNLSEPFPFPETVVSLNPTHFVCYVQYTLVPQVNCLPPRGLARP